MGNVYGAQNLAAYFIYSLNEQSTFVNARTLQYLLLDLNAKWNENFGHNSFSEEVVLLDEKYYGVKDVYDAYKEFGEQHLLIPAKEWYLEYGQFQLVHRTYGIPSFNEEEKMLADQVLEEYRERLVEIAS